MPYVKFISGHSETCKWVRQYLEKGGRALGEDFVNAAERGIDGSLWDTVMDATRDEYGTQVARRGQRARRYEHIIISLDPSDSVELVDFREFVCDIASRWFDGGIGRFQVAIVYHDDNAERIGRGERGVLHAHLVVNNAELDTGLRISPKLTPKVVNEFATDVNMRALERGWHGFSKDGVSMTLAEMQRAGTSPSLGRYAARQLAAGIAAPPIAGEREYVFGEDARRPARGAVEVRDDIPAPSSRTDGAPECDADPAPGRAARGAGGDTIDVRMTFARGGEHVFSITKQGVREDIPERRHRQREGYSWKQDIRDRVDLALRLSQSSRDFVGFCSLLGIGVSYSKDGEIKFSHPSAPDSRVVRGGTLGRDYSAASLAVGIALKDVSRRQRARDLPGRERYIRDPERAAATREAARAEFDSPDGASALGAVKEFLAYNDAHGIKSYGDYPDDLQGRAVRSYAEMIGAFDAGDAAGPGGGLPLMDRLELQRFLREETGAGGLERAQEAPRPGAQPDGEAPGDGPRIDRNL